MNQGGNGSEKVDEARVEVEALFRDRDSGSYVMCALSDAMHVGFCFCAFVGPWETVKKKAQLRESLII